MIGTERAAKASADGYTLTALNSSIMTMLPAIHSKVGYDPLSSFAPITMLVTIPTGLIVHPTVPVRCGSRSSSRADRRASSESA